MIKVAITGNIASGKSTVQNYLKDKGFKVIDTDDIAKIVREENADIIKKEFSNYDITDNDKISTKKLGNLIFKDNELRSKLDSILHPLIFEKLEKFFIENHNEKIVFVGIPLLFECNKQNMFDKIIFVQSDDEIRLKRLMSRNNFTKEEALTRINAQNQQEEKITKSDFILNNNNTPEALLEQISKICAAL